MQYFSIQLHNSSLMQLTTRLLVIALVLPFFAHPLQSNAEATSTASTTTESTQTESGTSGEDGSDGGAGTTSESIVVSGDADADTDVFNESNTNTTNTNDQATSSTSTEIENNDSATSTDSETLASTTAETASTSPETENGTSTTATTTITNTNNATTTTEATTTAETGANNTSGEITTISTGDATASANIVNVANTNIVNSNGLLGFFRFLFGLSELDIRDLFSVFEKDADNARATSTCDLNGCSDSTVALNIHNENNAVISNDVVVRSSTGSNTASGTDSYIETGRAHASANVVNVANTNIVDANYLMLTFSNFSDLLGDIVLPSASAFANFFSTSQSTTATTVDNTNTATVTNDVSATADTGGNSATSTSGDAQINTGDATASSNVYNQINTNLFNNDNFTMIFRIHGDWSGQVTGLPEHMTAKQTPFGIELFNTQSGNSTTTATNSNGEVTNTNNVTIRNNVAVVAMTGDNQATGTTYSAISTGDAHAFANVVNIANSNILGRNWALLIFDIFGDWSGNLSFGRPDLWIGGTARSDDSPMTAGSQVDYTFTVTNFSDTDATDVVLATDFDTELLSFLDDKRKWNIGDIDAGETVEVTRPASISNNIPYGINPLTLNMGVSSLETDDDESDNNDSVTIMAHRKDPNANRDDREPGAFTMPSKLGVSKTASVSTTTASSTVTYTITVENSGGRAFGSILYDTIYNENGEVIVDQQWDLDTIYTDEEITVTYDVFFASTTERGTYQNSAQIYAYDRSRSPNYGQNVESEIARVDVEITEPEGAVLGVARSDAPNSTCDAYLSSYMRPGTANDPTEVARLQEFLRTSEGFTDLVQSGVFDAQTQQAVRAFQKRYEQSILEPWKLAQPTGQVYYTTQKKINELYCDNEKTFPLSEAQRHEIAAYKNQSTAMLRKVETSSDTQAEPTASADIPEEPAPLKRSNAENERSTVQAQQDRSGSGFFEDMFSWIKRTLPFNLSVQ